MAFKKGDIVFYNRPELDRGRTPTDIEKGVLLNYYKVITTSRTGTYVTRLQKVSSLSYGVISTTTGAQTSFEVPCLGTTNLSKLRPMGCLLDPRVGDIVSLGSPAIYSLYEVASVANDETTSGYQITEVRRLSESYSQEMIEVPLDIYDWGLRYRPDQGMPSDFREKVRTPKDLVLDKMSEMRKRRVELGYKI